jgi:hypothetical protein
MHSNQISIGQAIQDWIREKNLDEPIIQSKLEISWEDIMGKLIAKNTKSIELRRGKLYITVSNASLKQELFYSREIILANLNSFLKKNVISEVLIY